MQPHETAQEFANRMIALADKALANPRPRMFEKAKPYFCPPFRYDSGMIWGSGEGGERMIDIRGWGHLTGTGAHNLPADKAAEIQDEIGEHLAQLLNANWPK